jgi:mannitol operon transcriptional antiterminator
MYITARERQILKILLTSPHLFISLNDISKELDVSLRTVQRELKTLEDTLEPLDLSIEKKQSEGIRLSGEDRKIKKLRDSLRSYSSFELEQNERSLLLFHELLKAKDGVKSGYLSGLLHISPKALQKDLNFFEEEIRHSGLSLVRKPGFGISLEGREKDKRMYFVNLALQRLEQTPIFSLKEGEFISLDKKDPVFKMLDPERLLEVEKILLKEVEVLQFTPTDLALFELILYLNLSLARISLGEITEKKIQEESMELSVAESVYKALSQAFQLEIPMEEIHFFASVLRSAKRVRNSEIDENMELALLANELIDSVSNATGYYYSKDKKFFDALVSHLEPLLNRMKEGITVLNPIKEEIKEAYGTLYGTLETILKQKFSGNHVSEDEVGFLTLHFASAITELHHAPKVSTLVLCTSGIATSRMLTKKLLGKFPQLTIIEQGSIWNLKKMDLSEFDLIISTVGIKDATFPYIQVNPMLTEEDERKLERVVNEKLLLSTRRGLLAKEGEAKEGEDEPLPLELTERINLRMRELLEGFRCFWLEESTLEEMFNAMMEEYQFIGEDTKLVFKDLYKKTLETGAGLPGSRVALVHGRHPSLTEAHVSVFKNRLPISILGMDQKMQPVDTFILLMAGEELLEEELELLSSISISLLEKENLIIFEGEDSKAMESVLKKYLKHTYLEIINRIWR